MPDASVWERGDLVHNVKDYGARGDGVNNDTLAIQAALNAASAAGGGTVFIPAGVYRISTALTLASNVEIVGAGRNASVLAKAANIDLIHIRGSVSVTGHVKYAGLKNLGLWGDNFTGRLIDMVYCSAITLRDLNLKTNNGIGIDMVEVWDTLLDNVYLVDVNSTTEPAIFIRSSRAAAGFGSSGDTTNNIRIINCLVESWKFGAIKLDLGTGGVGNPNRIWVENLKVETIFCRGPAIHVAAANIVQFKNITLHIGAFDAGFAAPQSAIEVTGLGISGSFRDISIANSVTATIAEGVFLFTAGRVHLDNIHGVYTTAPTTGKHVDAAGGGPYKIGVITSSGAPTNLALAATVFSLNAPHGKSTIASAAALPIPAGLRYAEITGVTNITSIPATQPGHILTLWFAGVLTVTDGGNLRLAGNFVTSADDTITLVCDGADWFEIARSVN